MRKFDGWITALFALVFIAAPALVGYYFMLPDWGSKVILNTGEMWGVAIGYIFYSLIFTGILILTKFLAIDSLSFIIPITLVLVAIFLTSGMPLWGRGLIVVALVLFAFPVNMLVARLKDWQVRKYRQK